ncbi:DUF221-domain-containing protein [Hortaea werneckii]|nr:DUF221-domain-containing protein [Hortaea werneckii]KAI7311774.1 DUF221-domain-containing protein [Hortaea werneckii]
MAEPPTPTATQCANNGILDFINCGSGSALNSEGTSVNTLLAAIAGSFASFGAQFLVFSLLRLRLSRIYRPRSYLVPERERVPPPPNGVYQWLGPLFSTPNLAFIQKCGLDAYFFLRYLRMLLKLFFPLALIILPILLPVNRYSGTEADEDSPGGLDRLSISNVAPINVRHRLWAHLILAIGVVLWFCYVVFHELRGYIRVRQAYLTSPQHRIRASATTVLVTGIPRKWLTLEALAGLYDVFPGGIKNIWINRNFDALSDKVDQRAKIAKGLEDAETSLIKLCRKKYEAKLKKERKAEGLKKRTRQERRQKQTRDDAAAEAMAESGGMSAGDQHETMHGLQDVLHEAEEQERSHEAQEKERRRRTLQLGAVGEGLDRVGLGAVNHGLGSGLGAVAGGFGALGRGIGAFGQRMAGDVDEGMHKAGHNFDYGIDHANTGTGFANDEDLYRQSVVSEESTSTPRRPGYRRASVLNQVGEDHEPGKTPMDERDARLEAGRLGSQLDGVLKTPAVENPPAVPEKDGQSEQQAPGTQQPHPFAQTAPLPGPHTEQQRLESSSPSSDRTLQGPPELNITRPSADNRPKGQMEIEEPASHRKPQPLWKVWKHIDNDHSLALPSPQPHTADEDEFPLNVQALKATPAGRDLKQKPEQAVSSGKSSWYSKLLFWQKQGGDGNEGDPEEEIYPDAYNKEWDADQDEEPRWRHYIEPKDRETVRLPLFAPAWFPSLPFVGEKVDRIYHLRRELARLNLEIEADQADVEKFPFMNSAFIQFNHQVAAHMACQSLSHHVPQQMAPRIVEISPDDVLWDNMSLRWWERYLRTAVILIICAGLIVLYAIPVTFTSLLSKVSVLADSYTWLAWLEDLPEVAISIIQGLLPPVLLSVILALVPIIFRLLVHQQGVPTGNAREMGVQVWYFAFLFIQVFFVVTLSSGLTEFFKALASQPDQVVKNLAENLPKAADYFFSYLMVQALSSSASALLQTGSLVVWFLLGPLLDSTPRQKWTRQTTLNKVQWGTFFPPFANFAVIGIIYSIIAPLILVFMLIIFSLFWIVYRYNVLYVYRFFNDTGGLLFPTAVNQLFVGVYFLELCLTGFFFISQDTNGNAACIPQGAIMIVVLVLTVLYQFQLNRAFDPLFKYLPITLEDEAVIRDEEFARAQASRFAPLTQDQDGNGTNDDQEDIEKVMERKEQRDQAESWAAEEQDRQRAAEHRRSSRLSAQMTPPIVTPVSNQGSWKNRQTPNDLWRHAAPQAVTRLRHLAEGKRAQDRKAAAASKGEANGASKESRATAQRRDVEAQHTTVGDVLFSGFADELEDLTNEERDLLVRYAFQHSALRAKRPVVWIPRDKLGVSDDEIKRAKKMSTVEIPGDVAGDREKGDGRMVEKTNIWMSNEGTALDGKGKVVFRRSPPDFSNVDLIAL